MFKNAKIKLILQTFFLAFVILAFFTFLIYKRVSPEVQRGFRLNQNRVTQNARRANEVAQDDLILKQTKKRILANIITIDLLFLVLVLVVTKYFANKIFNPLEKNLEIQKNFVANASHELKTPLTGIRTEAEIALRDRDLTLDQAKTSLATIITNLLLLQKLTESLLKENLYSSNSLRKEFKPLNLEEVLDASYNFFSARAFNKTIKVKKSLNESRVFGNSEMLIDLFKILFENSLKYSGEDLVVNISSRNHFSKVEITFEDNGFGMNSFDVDHAFERFYKSETNLNKDSFGLGLSLAKTIVDLHKGTIFLTSKLAKGTKFTITLPLK